MADLNIVTISGNIVRDPVLNVTPGGFSVVNFTVAINPYNRPDAPRREATYVKCVAWRGRATQIAANSDLYRSGKKVILSGELSQDKSSYTREDGTQVVRDSLQLVIRHHGPEGVTLDHLEPDEDFTDMDDREDFIAENV